MKKMKLVMVGNGMAGVRTLEELLKIATYPHYGQVASATRGARFLRCVVASLRCLDHFGRNDKWFFQAAGKVPDTHFIY